MRKIINALRVLHGRFHEWRVHVWPYYLQRFRNPRSVYLIYTPTHGNLGDHAIAQAETLWLNELRIPFIEVTSSRLHKWDGLRCLKVMNGRTILVHGGGYLGTIWPESEELIRHVMEATPRSRILFFPNTFYYDANQKAYLDLQEYARPYNAHRHLKLYAREEISYDTMQTVFRNTGLAPDMVLRLNKCEQGITRSGCVLCLRSDREKLRSEQCDSVISIQLQQIFGDQISNHDMNLPYPVSLATRADELKKQFDYFRHAELVVTDRLHGMIFCAISGTPCIVINSMSHKIQGCYEWIKDLPYIRFCDRVEEIRTIYQSIPKQTWQYDEGKLLPFYISLEYDILCLTKGKRYAKRYCHFSGLPY